MRELKLMQALYSMRADVPVCCAACKAYVTADVLVGHFVCAPRSSALLHTCRDQRVPSAVSSGQLVQLLPGWLMPQELSQSLTAAACC